MKLRRLQKCLCRESPLLIFKNSNCCHGDTKVPCQHGEMKDFLCTTINVLFITTLQVLGWEGWAGGEGMVTGRACKSIQIPLSETLCEPFIIFSTRFVLHISKQYQISCNKYLSLCVSTVDLLSLNAADGIFQQHELILQNNRTMDVPEMISCLSTIYETLAMDHTSMVNVPQSVDMCLNWLLNVYDT